MPNFIVKDRNNNPGQYTATSVNMLLADGTEQIMLPGEPEEKTVELDFSGGDMVVTPDDGKLITKVIIPKPDNLVEGNVREDVDIAGIVGTAGSDVGSMPIYSEIGIKSENLAYSSSYATYVTVSVSIPANAKILKVISGYGLITKTTSVNIPAPSTLDEITDYTTTVGTDAITVSKKNVVAKNNRYYGAYFMCLIVVYTV